MEKKRTIRTISHKRQTQTPDFVKRHLKERIFEENAVRKHKPIPVGSPAGKAQRAWNSWEQADRIRILIGLCGVLRSQAHLSYSTHWLALSLDIRKQVKRFFRNSIYAGPLADLRG